MNCSLKLLFDALSECWRSCAANESGTRPCRLKILAAIIG